MIYRNLITYSKHINETVTGAAVAGQWSNMADWEPSSRKPRGGVMSHRRRWGAQHGSQCSSVTAQRGLVCNYFFF